MQDQPPVPKAGAHNFAMMRDIRKKIRDVTCRAAEGRVPGSRHADAVQQPHGAIHRQTEIGHRGGGDLPENVNRLAFHVVRQLQFRLTLPVRRDALEV